MCVVCVLFASSVPLFVCVLYHSLCRPFCLGPCSLEAQRKRLQSEKEPLERANQELRQRVSELEVFFHALFLTPCVPFLLFPGILMIEGGVTFPHLGAAFLRPAGKGHGDRVGAGPRVL